LKELFHAIRRTFRQVLLERPAGKGRDLILIKVWISHKVGVSGQ
jgi:hypothetical protein